MLDILSLVALSKTVNGGGNSGVKVTEYVVTEDADRSLWLNDQNIKLVKGVNFLISNAMKYTGEGDTYVQGAVSMMLILWDGIAGECNSSANSNSPKSHIRGLQIPSSQWSAIGSYTTLIAGNTSKITVAENGLVKCTTSATGVTTGNYNNSFIEGGRTYTLLQAESEVVC